MNERIAKYDPSDEAISTYQEVGVVYLPDILDAEWIKHLAASIDEVVERDDLIVRNFSKIAETLVDPEKPAEPGSLQERLADKIGKATGRFLMGCGNWSKTQDLRALITHTCLGRIAGALMQSSEVRVHNDLMFCKEPGSLHRTAWHQDMSYWNIQGDQCLTLWIPVDVVDEGNGMMGYIRGSHRWQDEFKSNRIVSEITHEAAAGKTLTVEGHEDDASELIADGKSTETTVTLKPGTYTYYFTPHKAAGMVGTLTVT